MVGFLPQSTEAFTSGCPFSIDAPSSVEALFRRESMPPTSSATFGCRIRFVCLSTCNKQARSLTIKVAREFFYSQQIQQITVSFGHGTNDESVCRTVLSCLYAA